jgi:HK97 family phage major capsid protein
MECIHKEVESAKLWELKKEELQKCGCERCAPVFEKKDYEDIKAELHKREIKEAALAMGKQMAEEYLTEKKNFKEELLDAARQAAQEILEEKGVTGMDKTSRSVFDAFLEKKLHYGFSPSHSEFKNVYANTRFGRQQMSPHQKAVVDYIRTGSDYELKALQTTVGADGGYAVHSEMSSDFIKMLQNATVMRRSGARVENTGTGRFIVPKVEDNPAADKVAYTAERGSYFESDPDFSQLVLDAKKLTRMVKVSEEMLEDSEIDVERLLNEMFVEAFGLKEDSWFFNGAGGANAARGIVKDATQVGTVGEDVSASLLLQMVYALRPAYRQGAVWAIHTDTIRKIRELGLTAPNGSAVWTDGNLTNGQPDRLLGYPVYEVGDEALPLYDLDGAGAGTEMGHDLVFYNPKKYWIAQRRGLTIKRLNEKYSDTGEIGFLASIRVDGALADLRAATKATVK